MLYEYALDPALVLRWARDIRDYRQFVSSFGLGTTRIRSSVPKFNRWRSSVLKMLPSDCDENYGNRVAELVNAIGQAAEVYRGVTVDRSRPWIESVTDIDASIPFDYVLTDVVPSGAPPNYYSATDIYDHPDKCWEHTLQKPVRRTANNMADEVANMLRLSRKIVFVDPYFRDKPEKRAAIEAFIDRIFYHRVVPEVSSIAILYSANVKNSPSCLHLAARLQEAWTGKWGSGYAISLRALGEKPSGEKIHNRYVLTELGGVSFGIGLDEGEENHTDDVILLNADLYFKRWTQYFDCSAFDVKEEQILEL